MTSREKFEAWWEVNYHNGNPPRFGWEAWRDGDGYKIDDDESELDGMWQAWQAAESASEQKLEESRREFRAADATIHNLELQLTDMAVQLANAESKCRELAAENAYLLNGASRELNTSWMFHKTMLGAQAALVCLSHGYQAAAREWLEGTTDEAGAEMPDDISVGELHEWFESNMVSNGGNSGFLTRKEAEVAIRKECPATDAYLAEVRAQGVDALAQTLDGLIAVSVTRSYITEFAAQLRKGGAA
ncbi:hypothetical protein [Salmonella sp. ZJHZ21_0198]|uniref:hypothetical protein n=1 Tax=Salmonella sp. ZJHZ21_0198 TaxID=3159605 RepID=UPI00398031A5